jgi:hypothetical protein
VWSATKSTPYQRARAPFETATASYATTFNPSSDLGHFTGATGVVERDSYAMRPGILSTYANNGPEPEPTGQFTVPARSGLFHTPQPKPGTTPRKGSVPSHVPPPQRSGALAGRALDFRASICGSALGYPPSTGRPASGKELG